MFVLITLFVFIFIRFIKGCRAGDNTGFDIDLDDLKEMDEFHEIIVASAIFGTAEHELNLWFWPCFVYTFAYFEP